MFNKRPNLRCEGREGSLQCWRRGTEGLRIHDDGRLLCHECIQATYVGREIKVGDWMWERLIVCNPIDDLPAGVRWRKCTVTLVGEGVVCVMYEDEGRAMYKTIKRDSEHPLKFNLSPGDIPFQNEQRLFS